MGKKKNIILVAGGTGGHLFPALSLGESLQECGYKVHFITDFRARKYLMDFPKDRVHVLDSSTLKGKDPLSIGRMLWHNFRGALQSERLFRKLKPVLVAGFGGYPTLSPLFVAHWKKIPSFIHEQNAVMGRANKWLAKYVDVIAGGFLQEVPEAFREKLILVGNPVRKNVIEAAKIPYQIEDLSGKFHIVIFGGSQGAHFFSQIVPEALSLLPKALRRQIKITQQSRGDTEKLIKLYKELSIDAQIAPFFEDLPLKMAHAQYIIARAGASTVSELSIIGRPALLIPYPHALDHDQAENAAHLAKLGTVRVEKETELTANSVADLIKEIMQNREDLVKQAHSVKKASKPDALRLLTMLSQMLVAGETIEKIKEKSA